ncbi:MAG: DUF2807 domain-containing protein [Muribaculaceae bacterium]|nr:DUF2807 domain-containing protein [Muribaculaceae bacterium]
MKKTFLTIILLIIVTSVVSAQKLSRYELDVKDFTELKVIEGINVNYVCNPDSTGRAVFIATDELASVLMFNNTKGRLEMQIATDGIDYKNLPTVTVYSKFLTKVENSGDSTVRVLNVASCPNFKARLIGNGRLIVKGIDVTYLDGSIDTGNGQLILYGKCESAKLSCTGTGTIQADELVSNDTKCVMLGTGTIGCQALTSLNVVGASSGKVYYKGNPEQIKKRSVGVKIIPLDNEK